MSVAEKFEVIADKVFEAGQSSMVDKSKIRKKTASGVGALHIDDVSEIPHKVSVTLTSDIVEDLSDVTVTVCGKNLFNFNNISEKVSQITKFEDGTIIVSGYPASTAKTLAELCPNMRVGQTISFSMITNGLNQIYLLNSNSGNNKYIINGETFIVTEDLLNSKVYFYNQLDMVSDATITDIQFEIGNIITKYEPYFSQNNCRVIEGLVSTHETSPIMNITTDADVNIEVTYNRSYGMHRFFSEIQQNGERTNYYYAFYGKHWNDITFYPVYDIKPSGNSNNTFASSKISNIKQRLVECNVALDFSLADPAQALFSKASTTELPDLTFISARGLPDLFSDAVNLKTVGIVTLKEDGSQVLTRAFQNCNALENITFDGAIGQDLDIHWSTLLTKESIISIINALYDEAEEMTLTLSKIAINNAFGIDIDDNTTWSDEWKNLITDKIKKCNDISLDNDGKWILNAVE